MLEKDLGIWISNDLSPSTHNAKAVCKANQILGLIWRTFTYLDSNLIKQLFTSLVRPYLEFGNVVMHPIMHWEACSIELLEWCPSSQRYHMKKDWNAWIVTLWLTEESGVMTSRRSSIWLASTRSTVMICCHDIEIWYQYKRIYFKASEKIMYKPILVKCSG